MLLIPKNVFLGYGVAEISYTSDAVSLNLYSCKCKAYLLGITNNVLVLHRLVNSVTSLLHSALLQISNIDVCGIALKFL